ncbi:MAG: iron-sulfur cluster assembly accessory protein [Cyanobacteria bacterium P01_A01_bin.135]
MTIYITASAAKELSRLERQQGYDNAYLVIDVGPGGCLSLSYHLRFAHERPEDYIESDSASDLDKALEAAKADVITSSRRVAIAPTAQPHVSALKIDYSEDLLGGGFRFHNPVATSTCGCGHSFSI